MIGKITSTFIGYRWSVSGADGKAAARGWEITKRRAYEALSDASWRIVQQREFA